MKYLKRILSLILIILIMSSCFSQTEEKGLLTLERIFSSEDFSSERFGPVRWLKDGTGYTTLEKNEQGGRDIVKYEPESGKRKVLVSAEKLIPEDQETPLRIANYIWSSDRKQVMIFTNTRRVWRRNTRGDYWMLNLKTWELEKLGVDANPSTLMFAKFSPDGKKVAYVRENNIFVENLANHTITQLTHDGSQTIINGTFDWVYEEEFRCRDGFRWSPDGKKIAYWKLDAEGVGEFYMINNTDSLYPKIIPVQYPKAGTINSACKVGVVSATGGTTVWMKVPGDPRNNYIARMEWAHNSEEIMIQHLNRLQNKNEVMICDIKKGEVHTVHVEQDEAWVDVCNDVKWLENGQKFTWISEKDGWRHLYSIDRSGEEMEPITKGAYDAISIQCIDIDQGWVYFIASPDNPTQRYLYRKRITGQGEAEKLTPRDQPGNHRYQISPSARWAIHTYSTADNPPVTDLVRLPSHKRVRVLVSNKKLIENVQALKRESAEFFRVDIDEVELDGMMLKPYNFDASQKYPLLFYVYSEPAGQTAQDRWGGSTYLWHLMLTQKGYVVITVDNRGTPSPRGREWRKCIYQKVGVLSAADQAAAAKKIREWDFIDQDRIGIWGWSGGGSATLNALFRYPDIYHTGMSVAPVPDQRLYDTIYQERYNGLPQEDPEVYKKGSPLTYAENLKGNLLIVHGTGDDNVHYQGTERLINKLIKFNKPFTMMAYPNRSHGIYEGKNTTLHLRELLTRYLHENLPAGPR
ncbi:MAG: S9 family peptidase [bacterium]